MLIPLRYKGKQYNIYATIERLDNLKIAADKLGIDLDRPGGVQEVYNACVALIAQHLQNDTPAP
jgi:hypothetical protein